MNIQLINILLITNTETPEKARHEIPGSHIKDKQHAPWWYKYIETTKTCTLVIN